MADQKISALTAATVITGAEFEIIQGGSNKRAAATLFTTGTITFVIDGGGSTITTGIKGDLTIPFACTINEWTLIADQSGSIIVDIWKDTYANYPPIAADSIIGTTGTPTPVKPTITTATKGQSSSFTNWATTTINAGDTLRFNVDAGVTSVQRVTLSLKVTRVS